MYLCSTHSCTSPEGRSPMRAWNEVRRPSMHMVDNVGISFLNLIQMNFSLRVSEMLFSS